MTIVQTFSSEMGKVIEKRYEMISAHGIRNRNDAFKYGPTENVWKAGDNIFKYTQ